MEVNINNINTVSEVDMVCFTSESNQITSSLLIFIPKIKKKKKRITQWIFSLDNIGQINVYRSKELLS